MKPSNLLPDHEPGEGITKRGETGGAELSRQLDFESTNNATNYSIS